MLNLLESDLLYWVSQYFLPLVRLASFFMAAPIFSTRIVSTRIRLILTLSITILIVPILPPAPLISGIDVSMFIVVAQQILIGVALGFTFQVVFQLFVLAGQC